MDIASDKPRVSVTELIIPTDDQPESERCDDKRSREDITDKLRGVIPEPINESPILGRHFKLPDFTKAFDPDPPILDDSLPYIPVYTHLITHDLVPIERPKTPPILRTLRSRKALQSKNHCKSTDDLTTRDIDDRDEITIQGKPWQE